MPKASLGAQLCPPPLLPLVFQASRQRVWDQNGSAALNYLRWQSGRSLRAGEAAAAAASRCRRQPASLHLDARPSPRAPRAETFMTPRTCSHNQSPGLVCVRRGPRRLGRSWRRGRGAGARERARDFSRRFDTLCLNFNYLIKDFNSAVNSSANEPGAASEPKKGEHLAWNYAWRDSQSKCAWLPV